MKSQDQHEPTPRELEILRMLWEHGPSTVRQVQGALGKRESIQRTTVLKLMQIMHQKGLVERDESQHTHVYSPAQPRETIERQLVDGFIERVFGGSAMNLVVRALDAKPANENELAELRRLIDQARRGDDR